MQDVAKLAGVGASTVSRVVRDDSRVAPETQRRVWKVLKSVGYRVDPAARSLRTKRTGAVGFVVASLENPVFSTIASAAERALSKQGYAMVVASYGQLVDREERVLKDLLGRVDGLILSTLSDTALSGDLFLRGENTPVVLLDREPPQGGLDCVVVDHFTGCLEALRYLQARGHEELLIINRPVTISPGRQVLSSAIAANREFEGRARVTIQSGKMSVARGTQVLADAMNADRPPTGVLVTTNQLLEGVLLAVNEMGIDVPNELSIVGTDDTRISRLTRPALTVLSRDLRKMGQEAAAVILSRIDEGGVEDSIRRVLPMQLIERESVRRLTRSEARTAGAQRKDLPSE